MQAEGESQGGTSSASQGTSASGIKVSQSRSLGQKAIDFLMEKTKIKSPVKISKEIVKGQEGKEEEVDVWEYPEQDLQTLDELYARHAVLFNFSSKNQDLSLNDKRQWVLERLRGLEHIPGMEPEVSYHKRGRFTLRQSMLVQSDNKLGVWFINWSHYRGWIFDDNLDIPRWVWVLRSTPTVKSDIYPPYDSRWRQTGSKRMEEKDVGYLTKPMIDDSILLDDKQRVQTMSELHKLVQTAELAFLENKRDREEAQKSTVAGRWDDKMDCEGLESKSSNQNKDATGENTKGNASDKSTREEVKGGDSTTSLKRKVSDRESRQGDSLSQGTKRTQSGTGSGEAPSQAEEDKKMETEEEGQGDHKPSREEMDISDPPADTPTSPSTAHQQGYSDTAGRSNSTSSQSSQSTRRRTTKTVGEAVEGAKEIAEDSGADSDSDGDSGDENWEDEEEEEEPETLVQWIRTVHKLQWERHIECEIRLAHHKHLHNLKQATATGEDITTANRFERLKKE
ncbi:hypothetical protein CBR_g17680 [Chara braunii]|uniref:Uncharacterized protein n=1 Tax=Chara braunii TaxID=69332 RepID=A0A388KVE5_CHABU|nr:hypothetical protein CBR_g17680 [Chara braunii]|eukprot:GBG73968.1 hypothetical protein CBR_g17680 [Chara braunii]